MPLYNTATVAAALGTSPKWLDNLLSHNKIDGVSGGRQGVQRRLSTEAVRSVALMRQLIENAGLPSPAAVRLASAMLGSGPQGPQQGQRRRTSLSPAVWLEVDLDTLDREVLSRLAHAIEITPHPRRGRPRRSRESEPPRDA